MRPLYTLGFLLLNFFFSHAQTPTIISKHLIAGNCSAVAYGNGVWVGGGSGGNFTSPDAKTWTSLNSDTVPSFRFLAFGNGVFVGVANFSTIYSSSDGVNWTLRGDVGDIVGELNFTHGVFYVVNESSVTKSSDGINWAPLDLGIDLPTPFDLGGIAYNGSVYVIGVTILATQYSPDISGVLYSTTSEPGSWTFTDVSAAPPISNVVWVKDRFYMFAGSGISNSMDGIDWGPSSPPLVDTALDGSVGGAGGGVVFTVGDSVYLLGGTSLQVSADGTHFKSYNPPNLLSEGGLYANGITLIYGNGGLATATDGIHFKLNGTLFTTLATNGSGFTAAGWGGTGGHLFSSPDFANWTEQLSTSSGLSYISTIVYDGTKYVAAGSGHMYFSTEGTNWSDSVVSNSITAMDYGAGRYVGGSFYFLASSTDAINWSEVDSSYAYYYKIRYLNNNFFALGMSYVDNTGLILQSPDGIHWQNITPHLDSVITYYNDAMYDGTKYYFTGRKHWTDLFTISTTDPTNTTSYGAMGGIVHPAVGTSAVDYFPQFDDFIFHNGRFVGTAVDRVDSRTYLVYSTDGMNWTTSPLGGSGHGRTTVSDADIYHIVSQDGGFYTVSFAEATRPVLLRFEAVAVPSFGGENSRLSWKTKNDSDIAYFLVQHSLDTVHWDSIGRVKAEKREKEKREVERYEFIHEGPPAGANYYRLGLTDHDGRRWWSPTRKVEIRGKDIYIYPNPVKGVLHVQLPEAGRAKLIVFNRAWVPVREQMGNGYTVSINVRSLPAGVYYLLVFQDGKRYSKEFIIAD